MKCVVLPLKAAYADAAIQCDSYLAIAWASSMSMASDLCSRQSLQDARDECHVPDVVILYVFGEKERMTEKMVGIGKCRSHDFDGIITDRYRLHTERLSLGGIGS